MISRSAAAQVLTNACVSYWIHYNYSVFHQLGLVSRGNLRADIVALNTKRKIVICEVKSCIADFRQDHKWENYLQFCNQLYFVFDNATYGKHATEIKGEIGDSGALVLDPVTGYLKNVKRATTYSMDETININLLMRMAWRSGTSRRTTRRVKYFLNLG